MTTLVVIGDSLTENGTWPDRLSAETGWSLQREGRSGQTSTEIAVRVGARTIHVVEDEALPDGGIALRPDPVPGTVREHIDEGMDDLRMRGVLGDREGVLERRVSASAHDGWSFRPDDPRHAVPGARHAFRAHPLKVPSRAVVIVWCGRNNAGREVVSDVEAIVAASGPGARALVLGVHAAAFEPAGSPGARVVDALNVELSRRFGDRFVDVQSALVGAAPSVDRVAAAHLRSDDVHLSAAGDAVVAAAIRTRLRALEWWPHAGGS